MRTRQITITTGARSAVVDLTGACADFLREVAPDEDGLLNVYLPHATAGIVIMELGAGSDDDLLDALGALLPRDDRWRHRHGHRGHGADHLVPPVLSPSASIPVLGGRLALGTWQSVALVDTNADNLTRTVRLSFLAG